VHSLRRHRTSDFEAEYHAVLRALAASGQVLEITGKPFL
jgi:hypothetical protein